MSTESIIRLTFALVFLFPPVIFGGKSQISHQGEHPSVSLDGITLGI
jgi:hypothetical protein